MPPTTRTTTARAIRRPRTMTGSDYILVHPAQPKEAPHGALHRPRQLHRPRGKEREGQPQASRRRQEAHQGPGRRAEGVLPDDGRPRHRHGGRGAERRGDGEVRPRARGGRERPHPHDEGVHRGRVPEAHPLTAVSGDAPPEYRVKARNTPTSSENQIHDDAVARRYGFRGGLVPGVTVYAYMTHPLAEAFGTGWLERGTASVRFVKPVLHGEELTVSGTVTARDERGVNASLTAATASAGECAAMTATIPAGTPTQGNVARYPRAPLPAERPAPTRAHLDALATLGTPVNAYDAARAGEYLEKGGDALDLYRGADGFVPPRL